MKITAIKAQVKNPERVSVFLDGNYSFSLTLDQLLQEKLKKDQELKKPAIDRLIKASTEGKLKARAIEWLMGRPHSTREFRDYLYRKKADKEVITAWEDEFTDRGFLNDETFARWFAENRRRKHKSSRAIRSELISKGVAIVTIQKIVAELDSADQEIDRSSDREALKALINKLRKRTRYREEQKLIQYLLAKGFYYGDIRDELHNS